MALARGSRESGQALTGAALSGVLLCGGLLSTAIFEILHAGQHFMSDGPDNAGEYIVVARRYRPQNFEQLVGQQQATKALTNAIETNRVGHAYLFTGARGVGKTSAARIFSKSLNCEKGPTATPCDECDICQSIAAGNDVDVLEIDGASNRGIDEIRQLRSNVNVRPSRTRFKIYIIDEVHMLTKEAFNALLKTLEEPPDHVKFIFCTTDPEKIPITVLSRCQRFDFAPVELQAIIGRLKEIVAAEDATAEDAALELLARRAAGSMRDSQSLLEQLLAFGGSEITVDGVHSLLGTADAGRVAELAKALLRRDAAGSLKHLDDALQSGVDVGQLAEQLLGYSRDVMAVTVGAPPELLRHASASDTEELAAIGNDWGVQTILAVIQILDQTLTRMRMSVDRRTLLETALVRISFLEDLDDLAQLLAGGAPSTAPSKPSPPRESSGSASPPRPATSIPKPSVGQSSPEAGAKKKLDGENNSAATNAHANLDSSRNQKSAMEIESTPEPSTSTATVSAPAIMQIDSKNAAEVWNKVVDHLGGLDAETARSCDSVELAEENRLVVRFAKAFNAQRCGRDPRRRELEDILSRVTGRAMRIDFEVINADVKSAPPTRRTSQSALIRQAMSHPMVIEAMKLFDAEVTHVAERPGGKPTSK